MQAATAPRGAAAMGREAAGEARSASRVVNDWSGGVLEFRMAFWRGVLSLMGRGGRGSAAGGGTAGYALSPRGGGSTTGPPPASPLLVESVRQEATRRAPKRYPPPARLFVDSRGPMRDASPTTGTRGCSARFGVLERGAVLDGEGVAGGRKRVTSRSQRLVGGVPRVCPSRWGWLG